MENWPLAQKKMLKPGLYYVGFSNYVVLYHWANLVLLFINVTSTVSVLNF